ncbi:hypothetical protein B7Z28_00840 [Candidatus Saccharibacteria bacterium 32-45-3]|nr:MAG: hypothetical protein B7Z28_00840 [Candidatus Saccharibacteria bacterium 32-45-3]
MSSSGSNITLEWSRILPIKTHSFYRENKSKYPTGYLLLYNIYASIILLTNKNKKMTTSDTPETLSNPESEAKVRLLPAEVPVFIDLAETEEGNSRVVGSLYVGDMTQFAEHNPSSEDSGRFDILDLRRAPKDRYGNKLYDGRSFDPKTEFLVIQGIPDWDTGKGYVELPDDGVLTIGRKDPVSSKRFDVSSKYISREHVTIGYTDGKLVLQDEKSSNGTTFVEYPLGPSSRQIDDGAYDEGSRAIEISKQENIPVTLTEEEVGTWRDYLQYNEKAQTIAVQEMLSNPELVPTAGIVIDDMTFLLTDILENESTRLAMGYVASPND